MCRTSCVASSTGENLFGRQYRLGFRLGAPGKICLTSFGYQWYGCRTSKTEEVAMISRRTALSAVHEATLATRIILFVLALTWMSLPAAAQSTAGRVLGTVIDQSGASVAGATV